MSGRRRVEQEHYPDGARRDLHEQLEPLTRHRERVGGEPSGVTAGAWNARDEPTSYGIGDLHEDDGDRARLAEHGRGHRSGVGQDHGGSQTGSF